MSGTDTTFSFLISVVYTQLFNLLPISDKTVRHTYCALVLIFAFAVEQELILKNPMDKVSCPKLAKKKVEALTQAQAQVFMSSSLSCSQ